MSMYKYLKWFMLKQIKFGFGFEVFPMANRLRLFIVNIISRIVGTVQGDYHPLIQVYVRKVAISLAGPNRGLSSLGHPVSPIAGLIYTPARLKHKA